jgi:hypothetical protein
MTMAIRKEMSRTRRIDAQIIEPLRVMVLAGIPWRQPERGEFGKSGGYSDLIYIVTGHYYPVCDFIRAKDDYETIGEIWSELREDILCRAHKTQTGHAAVGMVA